MSDIYKAPPNAALYDSPNPQQEQIDYQLYKISGVGLATFFGAILAGGILLSLNFKRLGNAGAAKNALIYSMIGTVTIFGITFIIPESINIPTAVIAVPQILAMVKIAKQQQELDITRHIDNGGAMVSNWKAFGF